MKSRLVLLGVAALLALAFTAPTVGGANAVASGAGAAKATANQAFAKATKALKKANQANQKANAAQTTADAALTNAAAAQDDADAAAAAAASALTAANSKYDTVTFVSNANSASNESTKIDTVSCSTGRRVVGGGYTLGGTNNGAYVNINQPYGNSAWIVQAVDNGAVAGNWAMQVSANCIGAN